MGFKTKITLFIHPITHSLNLSILREVFQPFICMSKPPMTYLFLIAAFGLFTVGIAYAAAPRVAYTVSMDEPHTHYFDVTMKVSGVKQDFVDFKMPVWTPGSYLVREYAKNVEAFAARNGKDQPLRSEKLTKNTWRVYAGNASEVQVQYRVYAFEISVRTSFLDASHGYLQPAATFMYVKELMKEPATLTVKPYQGWNRISTGLSPVEKDKFVLQVPDYDILVDSPVEVGTQEILTFEALGKPHEVVMYGVANYDAKRLTADMQKIVEEAASIFGGLPYDRYVFIVHNLAAGGGGLEHLNSTTLQTSRWNYGTEAGYKGFLGLVAHEYFHLWNVKRIRPKALGPFDYDNENYTHLLWVAEGVTSYYDDMLVQRAGLASPDEYLNTIAGSIGTVENSPGNDVQSLAESGFDAWIKYYRPNENSNNTTVSYYTKGSLVTMALDLEILGSTNGNQSFDDVLRYLYEEYYQKQKRGFTDEEMQQAVEKIAGKKLDDFFKNHIFDTKLIDYDKYLGYAGLKLVDYNEGKNEAYLGAATTYANNKLTVNSVMRGTAAYQYGLNATDEILAFDNYRVTDDLNRFVATKKPGDAVNLLISRAGIVQNLKITLGKNPNASYGFEKLPQVSSQQDALLRKWLRIRS